MRLERPVQLPPDPEHREEADQAGGDGPLGPERLGDDLGAGLREVVDGLGEFRELICGDQFAARDAGELGEDVGTRGVAGLLDLGALRDDFGLDRTLFALGGACRKIGRASCRERV